MVELTFSYPEADLLVIEVTGMPVPALVGECAQYNQNTPSAIRSVYRGYKGDVCLRLSRHKPLWDVVDELTVQIEKSHPQLVIDSSQLPRRPKPAKGR